VQRLGALSPDSRYIDSPFAGRLDSRQVAVCDPGHVGNPGHAGMLEDGTGGDA